MRIRERFLEEKTQIKSILSELQMDRLYIDQEVGGGAQPGTQRLEAEASWLVCEGKTGSTIGGSVEAKL